MSTKFKDIELKNEVERGVNGHTPQKRRLPQELSVFGKTFVGILLAHAGIFIVLGLAVQQPVVLILPGFEALIAAFTLIGIRWVPILGSVLGCAMLFILTTATAFPIHHLTHPKDAFGYGVIPVISFLMYIVMTGLFWCAAMLAITGIATVIHSYFLYKWQAFPWFKTVLTGAICIWCGAIIIGAIVQPDPPLVALGPTTVGLQVSTFSQPSITLSKGERLTLIDSGAYHHNLSMGHWTNGQPVLASQPGAPTLRNKDVSSTGTTVAIGPFTATGTFYLICTLHRNMMLKIIVQ